VTKIAPSRLGNCHVSRKKHLEHRGFDKAIGVDGWPVDPRHPCYRGQHSGNFS
jgi:hypothetical protein